jgi:hypothetical protein
MISTPAGALRLGVLLLAVLIGGCLAGFGYTLSRLRSQALEAGLATATTHVRNFEEHLTQTLQVVDLVMANLEPNTQPDTETGTRSAAAAAAFGSQARAALRPTCVRCRCWTPMGASSAVHRTRTWAGPMTGRPPFLWGTPTPRCCAWARRWRAATSATATEGRRARPSRWRRRSCM